MSEASSLQKAMDMVTLAALRGELTVREFGEAMSLPKSTAHRLVASLVKLRLLSVHRGPEGDVYSVGRLVEELSAGQLSWRSLLHHARAPMAAARDETGETVGLHVLYAERRVLLEQAVSQHPHRWVYNNQMVPMPLRAGAAAKMLLAMLPPADMERIAARDHRVGKTKAEAQRALKAYLRDLQQVRDNDASRTADEINPGIASIAVPVIRDTRHGHPLAVLSLAGPSVRLTHAVQEKALPQMRRAAQQIAQAASASARGSLQAA
ncbi:MAG: hypothetical protein ABT05_07355 [Lautropia sp. SCN 66-9]|nr:MAG: hypothetical protein ABT05_07355 [Lautropia sp. SCN 66-9]